MNTRRRLSIAAGIALGLGAYATPFVVRTRPVPIGLTIPQPLQLRADEVIE